jgi:hypothetical protein
MSRPAFRSADSMRACLVCTATIIVTLASPGLAAELEPEPTAVPSKPLLERPGLYTALAGAVLLSLGLQLGAAASSIGSRIRDTNGDGLIDEVTRTEVLAAQRQAALATVMGTVGVLGVGAGIGWLILDSRESTAAPQLRVLFRATF